MDAFDLIEVNDLIEIRNNEKSSIFKVLCVLSSGVGVDINHAKNRSFFIDKALNDLIAIYRFDGKDFKNIWRK